MKGAVYIFHPSLYTYPLFIINPKEVNEQSSKKN